MSLSCSAVNAQSYQSLAFTKHTPSLYRSEYQTYTVYQAAKTQWKPTMFMDIRTGTEGIWTPWGHTMSLAEVPDSDILAWDRWFAAMNQKAITGAIVQVGGGAGSFGELTPGSVESTFYAPSEINAKYSMTAETYSPTGEGERVEGIDVRACELAGS